MRGCCQYCFVAKETVILMIKLLASGTKCLSSKGGNETIIWLSRAFGTKSKFHLVLLLAVWPYASHSSFDITGNNVMPVSQDDQFSTQVKIPGWWLTCSKGLKMVNLLATHAAHLMPIASEGLVY